MRRGKVRIEMRSDVIARDAVTIRIHHAEIKLRHRDPLLGRPLPPLRRRDEILRYPATIVINVAQCALRHRIIVLGTSPVPARRLGIVARNAVPIVIRVADQGFDGTQTALSRRSNGVDSHCDPRFQRRHPRAQGRHHATLLRAGATVGGDRGKRARR